MRSDGLRIIKATTTISNSGIGYDNTHSYMYGYEIDLLRRTAVLMRQSKRGGDEKNPESRLRQEGLVRVAIEIRDDHDGTMVVECDEGSGISGQKKIYERPKLMQLWEGIQNDTIGSVIVAREDRLFRDRFLTQATQFAEACAKHKVILIVAGRRCYDFRIQDDFNAFLRKMQEAYGYIDTHVRYMNEMRQQKHLRGEWVGGALIAPFALDRKAIELAREQRKIIKEFGGSEDEETIISKAFRPVIYEPWHELAVDLFEKFRIFNFSASRLGRYIESRPYIFPLPEVGDQARYMFKLRMKLLPGKGYTFADSVGAPSLWMANLTHLGYASAGKDEHGNRIYIEGAFDASIPYDLFEPCYEAITGFSLDGEQTRGAANSRRFIRKYPAGQTNALLTEQFTSPDVPMKFYSRYGNGSNIYYYGSLKPIGIDNEHLSEWDSNILWTLPVQGFDRAVVDRLAELATHDKELADRIEKYYAELQQGQVNEKAKIVLDIRQLEGVIARYDHLLTEPAQPLTKAQEKRYLESQAGAEIELEQAHAALDRYERLLPNQFISAFYRILGRTPGDFWNMDVDHQRRMLSLLINEIQIKNISPHMYTLVLKWKDPVASRWDSGLICKRYAVRSGQLSKQEWTDDEDWIVRRMWAHADRFELARALPTKTRTTIRVRASELGIGRRRELYIPRPAINLHTSLCYEDWTATCAALNVDHESEEGLQVLEMLNYYSAQNSKTVASFWWVLPVAEISFSSGDMS